MCPARAARPASRKVFKLSSNETPLGPSPKAVAAYRGGRPASGGLSGRRGDRAARGDRPRLRTRPGAHRLRRGLRRPAQPARARLSRRRRRGDPHRRTAFWSIRSPRSAPARSPWSRPEKNHTADVDAILAAVTPRTQGRVPRQPEQSDRHLSAVRRGQAPARAACRRMCCWCSTPPMPNTSSATITRPARAGRDQRQRRDDAAPSPRSTASRRCGSAGWYGPAHVVDAINRIRGPFNVNAPAIARRHRGDRGHRASGKGARAQRAMARLAHRGDRQARARGHAERGELHPDPFPAGPRAAAPARPTPS